MRARSGDSDIFAGAAAIAILLVPHAVKAAARADVVAAPSWDRFTFQRCAEIRCGGGRANVSPEVDVLYRALVGRPLAVVAVDPPRLHRAVPAKPPGPRVGCRP